MTVLAPFIMYTEMTPSIISRLFASTTLKFVICVLLQRLLGWNDDVDKTGSD